MKLELKLYLHSKNRKSLLGRLTIENLSAYELHKELQTKILQHFFSAKLDVYKT